MIFLSEKGMHETKPNTIGHAASTNHPPLECIRRRDPEAIPAFALEIDTAEVVCTMKKSLLLKREPGLSQQSAGDN